MTTPNVCSVCGATRPCSCARSRLAGAARVYVHGVPTPHFWRIGDDCTALELQAGIELTVSLYVEDNHLADYEALLQRCLHELRRMRGSTLDAEPSAA